MSKEKNSILQDKLLSEMRQKKIAVTIFLINGVKLQGVIVAFDDCSVLLQREHTSQLIFKRAISTVMPLTSLSLRVSGVEKVENENNDESKQQDEELE